MSKKILRILVSELSEEKFVIMNAIESVGKVDLVLVVEHNYTHSGTPRELIYPVKEKQLKLASKNEKLRVLSVDLEESIIKNASTSEEMHFNENLMRKSFLSLIDIEDNDMLIAVDADEIIYRKSYFWISLVFSTLPKKFRCFSLRLYQFQYKMNYLWVETVCRATTVVSGEIAKENPRMLRDVGRLIPKWAGCHFSWQLSVEEMKQKISKYAHNPEYQSFADTKTLEKAIIEKLYPFDPLRPFTIKELNRMQFENIAPKSFFEIEALFPEHLVNGLK